MTGPLNEGQEPSNEATVHPLPSPSRQQAKDAAYKATIEWYDAIERDMIALLESEHVTGHHRCITFTVGVNHAPDENGEHLWREAVREVQLIGIDNEVSLTAGENNPNWATAVELWVDLLNVLSVLAADQTDLCLLIDVDTRTIAAWEPYYCPDEGTLPPTIQVVPTIEEMEKEQDLFFQLLNTDPEEEMDEALDAIQFIMELHELDPPSTPAHPEGECDAEEEDKSA